MLRITLVLLLALKVSAQSSSALVGSSSTLTATWTFLTGVSDVNSVVGISTSYRQPSLVPFNSGPDPFPIVLPSTVIRSSSTTIGPVTLSSSGPPLENATSDPYTLPKITSDLFDSVPVSVSTPTGGIIPTTPTPTEISVDDLASTSVLSVSTDPVSTVTASASNESNLPSQSEADSLTNAKKRGWQKVEYQACVVLGLVALLVASM